MCKLYASLVAALTSIMSANVCSDSITVVDQKNALSDNITKSSKGLEGHIDLALDHYRLYLDSAAIDITESMSQKPGQCSYTVTLGQDNSIKLSSADSKCTNKDVRAAAEPYKLAQLYLKGGIVSFANAQKGTLALYQCFNSRLCAAEGYGPEQVLGEKVWVLLAKNYVTHKPNNATQDTYHLKFTDHKHAAYFESLELDLPLQSTLVSKADANGYLSSYVDGLEIFLVARNIEGLACNYGIALNLDNSIVVRSVADGCFNGYVREASGPYKESVTYKKGDIVIEQDFKKQVNYYYQCVISSLCNEDGYTPFDPDSYLAWSLVYSKRFVPQTEYSSEEL